MVVAENNKPAEPLPRREIPDEWAGRGHCPACGATPLRVVHIVNSADYLLCPRCELSFEVAASGGTIRIKNCSEKLEFAEAELRYRWVQPASLSKLLENRTKILQEKATSPISSQALTDEDVWNRMLSLYKMGNKPKMIQYVLIQSGATQAQSEAAFVRLKKWTEQDAQRQTRRLWTTIGAAFLLIFALFGGAWAFTIHSINSQLDAGMKNPSVKASQPLPLEVLKSLPDGIKPGFLKSPAAQVASNGPGVSGCPRSASEAAALFGGSARDWTEAQFQAWQMVSTGNPTTVRVPAGMVAGYIDNKSFNFLQVNGPATVYNVNFVAMMCE